MIQVNNLTKKADTFADNLDELGVDVIDIEPIIDKRAFHIITEAGSDQDRDETVRYVTSAYQYAVHSFGDETVERIDIELRAPTGERAVEHTVKREWLPADRDDVDGWDRMIDLINRTHEVIHDD